MGLSSWSQAISKNRIQAADQSDRESSPSMSEESTMTQVCVKYDNREGVSDTDLHNVYTLWMYVIS